MSKVDIASMMATKTENATHTPPDTDDAPTATPPTTNISPEPNGAGPKWQQCEPQTIYMWPAAIDELKTLARQLQRAKEPGVGERITMATLVRVAVSRLLEQEASLDGTTETELLNALRNS